MNLLKSLGISFSKPKPASATAPIRQPFAVASTGNFYNPGANYSLLDGDKFVGGFGPTQLQIKDYWALRQRSIQLFNDNLYGRGLIRRLITNEINTGLSVEAIPEESIIGVKMDSLADWSEGVESRFGVWGRQANVSDYMQLENFGAKQREARRTALITGDVLVVLKMSKQTKLPMVHLVSGASIQTPLDVSGLARGHRISLGVELDRRGRQVAYHIRQTDGTSKRQPALGPKSGRRLAWLVYGTDRLISETRGVPLLGIILQSLKEIDRYRDSAQRKAVINSILAMYIKKGEDKIGTLPTQNGAVRHDTVVGTNPDGSSRDFQLAGQIPGVVYEELQQGEEPVGFHSQGTDINFGEFEGSIIRAIAWANEMPPEILQLSFSNNYSASQAAINEFKIYLNKVRSEFGASFCQPIYQEWLISEVLQGRIVAAGLLQSWRDPSKYDVFGAWMNTDWSGAIKPSTDILKQAKGNKLLVDEAWMTNARSARELTGMKFDKNVRLLKRENQLKAEAMRPILELNKEFGPDQVSDASAALERDSIEAIVEEAMEAQNDG